MLNQHSLEELLIFIIYLEISKKEYEEGIKPILIKNSPARFRNPHTVLKIKKIQINWTWLSSSEYQYFEKKY
jgi:hypothetical protein